MIGLGKFALGSITLSTAGGYFYYKQANASQAQHLCMIEMHTADPEGFRYHLNEKEKSVPEASVNPRMNHFIAAVTNIPHYKKRARGGEDGFILSEELIACADGVGGWARKGVDPGIFAKELCGHVWNDFKEMHNKGDVNLK